MHSAQINAVISTIAKIQNLLIEQLDRQGLISKKEIGEALYAEAERVEKLKPELAIAGLYLTQFGALLLSDSKPEEKREFPDWFQGVVQGGADNPDK